MSLTMFYNIFHKHVACHIFDSLTAPAHNRNLQGNHSKLFVPFVKQIGLFEKIFLVCVLLPIWNILPSEIFESNVCSAFTYRLKNFNLASFFYLRN